jgi:TRAP-type C4-dicarboxylate transport system permease small subunit
MAETKENRPVKVVDRVVVKLEMTLAVALVAAVMMNVTNVVARYVFGRSIDGVDEIQIYLMVALAFFGSVVASVHGQHLRMDVLVRTFPRQFQKALNGVEAVATAAICAFVCWISTNYALRMHEIGTVSENAHLPMWIPHSIVAVAFGMLTVLGLARLLSCKPKEFVQDYSANLN